MFSNGPIAGTQRTDHRSSMRRRNGPSGAYMNVTAYSRGAWWYSSR